MSVSTATSGRASQACKRCHTRKKRCDRELPRCGACSISSVQCSFQEHDDSSLFPISYVRGLEQKVRQLEEQLGALDNATRAVLGSESTAGVRAPGRPETASGGATSPPACPCQTAASNQTGDALELELKSLSLEATAERYLGSSSGLSFARLTQAVLKRLKPDQYPFAFEASDKRAEHDSLFTNGPQSSRYQDQAVDLSLFIDEEHAIRLSDYYWSHNHTLYPFLRKVAFKDHLRRMYARPEDLDLRSHLWLYTMWMVLAIGSTAWSSIMMDSEAESVQYFDKAMEHFEGALSFGATSALTAILLQISYSFFNKVGPNTWYLVGVGVRIAIGIGLHTAPSLTVQKLPLDVQESRKRLFFSLYMMDRLVSISLGRPFGIQDQDVEVEPFANVDDENIFPDIVLPQSQLYPSSMAVPLHILALRRIAGDIFEQIYSNKNRHLAEAERNAILQNVHQKIIDWRRDMPFPLPQSKSLLIPQFSTAWYDLNYYQHVLMAYRPSPLFPVLTLEKVGIIANASSMFISQVATLQRQKRLAFNWLNLFQVFTATLTLIYSITAQPEPLPVYLQRTNALSDLTTVCDLLSTFGTKFPSALKCREIVHDVLRRLQYFPDQNQSLGSQKPPPGDSSAETTSLFGRGLVAHATPQASDQDLETSDESGIAWPFVSTGNGSYDELQNRMKSVGSPSAERDIFTEDIPSTNIEFESENFGYSFSPFGNAAAQYLATGLGTSADMDLDEEMLNFIGLTTESLTR